MASVENEAVNAHETTDNDSVADVFDTIAAVDLGSNSFHMIVARVSEGEFRILDRMREMVRLAAGLGEDKQLTDEAIERAQQASPSR